MKRIRRHKTTITAAITGVLCIGAVIRWYLGQIDSAELQNFCTAAGTISVILVGIFSKDGEIRKNENGKARD